MNLSLWLFGREVFTVQLGVDRPTAEAASEQVTRSIGFAVADLAPPAPPPWDREVWR